MGQGDATYACGITGLWEPMWEPYVGAADLGGGSGRGVRVWARAAEGRGTRGE